MTEEKKQFDDGGKAFPNDSNSDGMSLWDYYAAAALNGMLATDPRPSAEICVSHASRLAIDMIAEKRRRESVE